MRGVQRKSKGRAKRQGTYGDDRDGRADAASEEQAAGGAGGTGEGDEEQSEDTEAAQDTSQGMTGSGKAAVG